MRVLAGADWIIDGELKAVRNGWIAWNGKSFEILPYRPTGCFDREFFFKNTVLMPPLVNAHTHFELTNLIFSPSQIKDFFQWLLWIISVRQLLDIESVEAGVVEAIKLSESEGVAYVGDISSFGVSANFLKSGVSFQELIGKSLPKNICPPISVHAVYSTSFELLKDAAAVSKSLGMPFQMHLGESAEEQKFVRGEENLFEKRIYPIIGRKRYDDVYAKDLVEYLELARALNENLIAVHCTNLSRSELKRLMDAGAGIVICPRSNLHLNVGFPDVELLQSYPKLALGTDGLSSNVSLSVLSEIRTVYYKLRGKVSLKNLLRAATFGGAEVLQLKDYFKSPVFTKVSSERKIVDAFDSLLLESASVELFDLRCQNC